MKCPHCEKEINSLTNIESGTRDYTFWLREDGEAEYDTGEFLADDRINTYSCPECSKVIAKTDEGAVKFLRGE